MVAILSLYADSQWKSTLFKPMTTMTLFIRKRQKCQSVNAQSHSQCLSSHHKITPHPVVCGILFVKFKCGSMCMQICHDFVI